jgi:hypothetical protein
LNDGLVVDVSTCIVYTALATLIPPSFPSPT